MSKGSEEKGTVPWQGIWTWSCKILTVFWNRESEILREAVRAIGSEKEEEGAYLKHCRGRICTTLWEWESRKESRMTLNSGFGTWVSEVPLSEWKKKGGGVAYKRSINHRRRFVLFMLDPKTRWDIWWRCPMELVVGKIQRELGSFQQTDVYCVLTICQLLCSTGCLG